MKQDSHAYTVSTALTFHLSRDDLDAILRQVEGVVEGDGVSEVGQYGGLVCLLQEPHTGCAQDIEGGLGPLLLWNVTLGKVQERYQTLVGLLWAGSVSGYTWKRGEGKEEGRERKGMLCGCGARLCLLC